MKKVVVISFVLMMAIGLAGCGKSKQEKALDDFTDKMEGLNKDMMSEMKKMEKTMEKKEAAMEKRSKKKVKKTEKTTAQNLEGMKGLKKCIVKADSKKEALDCHRELDDFTNDEAAAINTGINEWTKADKEKVIKRTDNLIKLLEMHGK